MTKGSAAERAVAMGVIYLLGSLLGIGALVGLNVILLGHTRTRVDLAGAVSLLAAEQPGFRAGMSAVTDAGDAALVEDIEGTGLYIVTVAGDKLVSRRISRDGVRKVARAGRVLTIRFRDFTFPRANVALSNDAAAKEWEHRLTRTLC